MDISEIDRRLQSGQQLKIRYRYPRAGRADQRQLGERSDRLMDVSIELERFYTLFRGETPIWLEADEILEVTVDDGIYKEFDRICTAG